MKPTHRHPITYVKSIIIPFFLLLFISSFSYTTSRAQVSLGADLMSRYVWRGIDFGNAVSIQPSVSYARGGFEIGTWASYGFGGHTASADEHDIWVGYSFVLDSGSEIGVGVTDYYFPNAGIRYFDLSNDGGAHQIEPYLTYSGPSSFPISFWASIFVHNEPQNATYLEASYPFKVEEVELSVTAGGVPTKSDFYLNPNGAAITNLSLSATRTASISENFSMPLSVKYILNPHLEISYLVFGIS